MPFAWVGAAASVASAATGVMGAMSKSGATSQGQQQATSDISAQQAKLDPYNKVGTNALGVAGNLSGANGPDAATAAMADFQTSPGYQWRFDQGMRGIDAGAAAKGMLRSGATLKGEMEFGQGLASSEFDKYYNRLYGLATLGETAAAGGSALAQTQAAVDTGAAGKQASIYGDAASGLGTAIGSLGNNPKIAGLFGSNSGSNTPVNNINSLYNGPAEQAYYNAASSGSPYAGF